MDINANLDAENKPVTKTFVVGAGKRAAESTVRKQKTTNSKKSKSKKPVSKKKKK